jgi:hypothetical protein
MSFSRPIHWYHSHADPIWPDCTFNVKTFRLCDKFTMAVASVATHFVFTVFSFIFSLIFHCWERPMKAIIQTVGKRKRSLYMVHSVLFLNTVNNNM